MTNAIFPKGREAFATGLVNWVGDPIDAVFVDTNVLSGGVIDINAVQFLSDIDADALVATVALAGKDATNGVLDANDVTAPEVEGDSVEVLVICTHTGDPSTSRLLVYIDDAQGLPVIPNTGDIRVQWPPLPGGIATL
jgi:hypothetical protein